MERARGEQEGCLSVYALLLGGLPLPIPHFAGQPTCIFVTVNRTWRYFAATVIVTRILLQNEEWFSHIYFH